MHTRRILTVCLLAFAAVLAAALSYVAIVSAREPDLPPRRALVTPLEGEVSVRGASSEPWVRIEAPTELFAGASVRTGEHAMAEIDFFGQGVSRLEADTTVILEQLAWDEAHEAFSGSIFLEAGRVWSRLLDFLAPESSYEIRTATLSATVRGTSFAVQVTKEGENVMVDEHAVHVVGRAKDWEREVGAGLRMDVMPTARRASSLKMAWFDRTKETWILEHRAHDARYAEQAVRVRDAAVAWYGKQGAMMDMADRARVSLDLGGEGRQRAATRILSRAAGQGLKLLEAGNKAAADETFRRAADACARAQRRGAVCRLTSRMDEALVRRGLELTEENLRGWNKAFPEAMERLRRIQDRRAIFAPSPAPVTPVSEAPTMFPSGTPAASSVPVPMRLELAGERFTFGFGESGTFNAYVRWSDGRTEDVTKLVRWTVGTLPGDVLAIGQMQGNVFTAGRSEGEADITATYTWPSGDLAVSDTLHVVSKEPVIP